MANLACGHDVRVSEHCDETCAIQNAPATEDHAYVTMPNGERFCPKYVYGGSMGLVCATCGFEPPNSMTQQELKKRIWPSYGFTVDDLVSMFCPDHPEDTRPKLVVEIFFNETDPTEILSEVLGMVADELGAEQEGQLFGHDGKVLANWNVVA